LEQFPLPSARYDLVVCIHYLQRSLLEPMRRSVRPGGVVVFETYLRGESGHPRNPAYRLAPGELAASFSGFEVLDHEEGRCDSETGPVHLARIVARRPAIRV
jgi:SAM-dependent methyltransferase